MTRRRILCALSALAGALALAPAPAYASRVLTPCSMVSSNDPSGALQSNPDVQMGVVAASYTDPTTGEIVLSCEVYVNNSATPSAVVTVNSGGWATMSQPVSYIAGENDVVSLCTRVVVRRNPGNNYDIYGPCLEARMFRAEVTDVRALQFYVV